MSEGNRRYRQSELEIENFSQRRRLIKDDLEGLNPDFSRWVREANKRRRRADAAVQVLMDTGLVSNYREGLEHLQSVVLDNLDSGALELRRSDFKNRFHFFGTRGLVKRPKEKLSVREQAGFSIFAYGNINHRVAFDALEGKLPRSGSTTPDTQANIEEWDHTSGETRQVLVEQGVLFDRSEHLLGADNSQHLTPEGRMTTPYAFDVFDSLFSLQEMTAEGAFLTDEYFDELYKFEGLMAPVLGTHFDDLQSIRGRFDYDPLYAPALMSVGTSVLYAHGQSDRVLFRELPVISWQRNHVSGGRIDALEITGFEGRPPTDQEKDVLRDLSEEKFSSVGELLVAVGDSISPWLSARIIDVKCSIGDATSFNKVIDGNEIAEGPIPSHMDQVRDYLTHAPVDLFTHEYDDERDIDHERVWNEDDGISEGEILYFHPAQMPKSYTFSMTPEEKLAHFKSSAAAKLEQAQANALIRFFDTTVGKYTNGVVEKGEKQRSNVGKPYTINPQMLQFIQSLK